MSQGVATRLLSKAQWPLGVVLLGLSSLAGCAMQLSRVLRAGQLLGYKVLHSLGDIWGISLTTMSVAREAGALATNQLKTPVFLLKAKAGVLPGPLPTPSLCALAYALVLGI